MRGRGRKSHEAPAHREAEQYLDEYIAAAEEKGKPLFRTKGITEYLRNGGTIEHAQQTAEHESPRTRKLYDRTGGAINLDEVERIVI